MLGVNRAVLPFSALVGQESMRLALLLNAINPGIGGALIRGHRGTAKSTAVRSLAELLPEVTVVTGCVFGCDPDDPVHLCADCRQRSSDETLPRTVRPMRVVELPVNASEDRLVGSINIERAIRSGERAFEAGVLAQANRNILYVDEVNLLDDHLIDVLLDAAAMGVNVVEREGISVIHPARMILVGTMNPEEGELRPQLLDRFGLCVDIVGLRDVDERVAIMEQTHRRDADHEALRTALADEQERLHSVVVAACELLPLVTTPRDICTLVALTCIEAGVVGHRADLVLIRTARTLCALREAETAVDHRLSGLERGRPADALRVTPRDVIVAADLALAHRRRPQAERASASSSTIAERAQQDLAALTGEPPQSPPADEPTVSASDDTVREGAAVESGAGEGEGRPEAAPAQPGSDSAFDGDLFRIKKIRLPRDRRRRRASGKRSASPSQDRRGRYVGSEQAEHTTDVALDATLRAAAPHQVSRRAEAPGSTTSGVIVERQDLRQKVRRRRTGTLIVFVVDASASMDAEQRMQATKGAILSLLRDAYIRRDKVSLVVFSGRTARTILQPTSSVDLAEQRLQSLAVGGTTPLTHGLVAGLKVIRNQRVRDPSVVPLLVLISDGRGNISLFGDEPMVEAQRVIAEISDEGIRTLVIDSARDFTSADVPRLAGLRMPQALFGTVAMNACKELAERARGEYLGLYDLSHGAIVAGIEKTLRNH